jgi:hypothetical protein
MRLDRATSVRDPPEFPHKILLEMGEPVCGERFVSDQGSVDVQVRRTIRDVHQQVEHLGSRVAGDARACIHDLNQEGHSVRGRFVHGALVPDVAAQLPNSPSSRVFDG